jgi:hypothetical protein
VKPGLAAVCLVLALAGCGAASGGHRSATTASSGAAALTQAERTHEYPSPVPARERAPGALSAAAAVRAFAAAYINWRYDTIASDLRRLAAASVGQARAAMTLAAAQTAGDYELQRGRVSNQGTVEVVAPRAGDPGQYVVVTEELTTAAATTAYEGLEPAWHVALATVSRQPDGGYAVSAWQPQS